MEDRSLDERLLEELGPALDAWAPAGARAAFRDAVRVRFLASDVGAGEAAPVVRLSAALDTYSPVPRPEFRAGLREAFLAEATAAEARDFAEPDELPDLPDFPDGPDSPDGEEHHPGVVRRPRVQRAPRAARATRTRFRVLAGGAIASLAAAAALVVWLMQPDAMSWRVEPQGFSAAGILVDGVALAGDAAPAELERLLADAHTLRTGEEALRLVLGGDVVVVEIGPESQLDLTGIPANRGDDIRFAGSEGAFRLATAEGYRRGSQRLSFRAHAVTVEVTGTVFGVDVYGEDVCVCCCHGSVQVNAPGGAEPGSSLAPGETRYVHADGRSNFVRDLEGHQAPLRALQDYRNALRRLSE